MTGGVQWLFPQCQGESGGGHCLSEILWSDVLFINLPKSPQAFGEIVNGRHRQNVNGKLNACSPRLWVAVSCNYKDSVKTGQLL